MRSVVQCIVCTLDIQAWKYCNKDGHYHLSQDPIRSQTEAVVKGLIDENEWKPSGLEDLAGRG